MTETTKQMLQEHAERVLHALTFGDQEYKQDIEKQFASVRHPVQYMLELLLKRIQSGAISHNEYWVAVRGIEWGLATGRIWGAQAIWLRTLSLQDLLLLIEEIRVYSTLEAVADYCQQIRLESVEDERYKDTPKLQGITRLQRVEPPEYL